MIIDAIKIPSVNPIRHFRYGEGDDDFFYNIRKSFEYQNKFCYPFKTNETIYFQIALATGAIASQSYQLIDFDENVITTGSAYNVGSYGGFTYYHYSIGTGLSEGNRLLRFTATLTNGLTVTLYSEPISISDSHEDTILIKFTHSENNWNTFFYSASGIAKPRNWYFKLRIKGGLWLTDVDNSSRNTVYIDETYNAVMLDGQPFNVEKWTFGDNIGLPTYIGDVLNRLFLCDDVTIDGVGYCRNEGAKLEKTFGERYAMPVYKMELIRSQNQLYKLIKVPADIQQGIGYMQIGTTFKVS